VRKSRRKLTARKRTRFRSVIGLIEYGRVKNPFRTVHMLVRENKAPSGSREPAKQSYASFSLAKEAASVDGLFHWRKSPIGPSRHFGAMQNLVGIGAIADIE